jgi:hypothetical protein
LAKQNRQLLVNVLIIERENYFRWFISNERNEKRKIEK